MRDIPISSYLGEQLSEMLDLVDDLPKILRYLSSEQACNLEEEQTRKRSRD